MSKRLYLAGSYRTSPMGRPQARCWGWYDTPEEALERMNRDWLFFEGGYYTFGVIEAYPYGDSLPCPDETRWFKPVYKEIGAMSHVRVEPCDPPESSRGIVGFLL